jgi:hypothetical protein
MILDLFSKVSLVDLALADYPEKRESEESLE